MADMGVELGRLRSDIRLLSRREMVILVQSAIKEADSIIQELWEPGLVECDSKESVTPMLQLQLEASTGAEKMIAYTKLHSLHLPEGDKPALAGNSGDPARPTPRCPRCREIKGGLATRAEGEPRPVCEVMRALLLIRDLVMLALVDGRHGLTYKPLMEIFESV